MGGSLIRRNEPMEARCFPFKKIISRKIILIISRNYRLFHYSSPLLFSNATRLFQLKIF
jgi:hypothetical protein